MTYTVLARKYRPQRFADMVGQDPVVRTLTNALAADRIHHAYVFSGIRGIGKTTSARLLARALNCEKGPTPEPCGACPACLEIAGGHCLDAIEIDAASNRGIDEVKSLIQSAQYAPARDRFKVYIVDEFHMLTREAFNALLKTLEEPPRHVVFILATTELEKVPETILSRCLLLNFRAVPLPTLKEHLLEIAAKEGVSLDEGAAELVARKAGGSVRDAQSTLDRVIALAGTTVTLQGASGVLGVMDAAALRRALGACLSGNAADALRIVAEVAESGADPQGFLDDLLAQARAALLSKVLPDAQPVLGVSAGEMQEIAALAQLGSEEDLRRVVDRLIEAGPRLRTASEPRYFLEALVVRLSHLTRLQPLAELIAGLSAGGDGASPAGPAGPPSRPRSQAPASAPQAATSAGTSPPPPAPEPSTRTAAPSRSAAPAPPGSSAAVEPPRPATGGGGAAGGGREKGSSWRDRIAAGTGQDDDDGDDEDADLEPEPVSAPPLERRAARAAPSAARSPLSAFRAGLPARLRAQADQGLMRAEGDGLALLVPGDRGHVVEHLTDMRFHLMGAAAEAFGRPVPVRVAADVGLLAAPLERGDLEGLDFAARRLQARAASAPSVRAVLQRFDGRVSSVLPEPPAE